MRKLRKKVFVAAGYNTIYFGSGRKEFDPNKPMRGFEEYLKETAEGTMQQAPQAKIDEGIIGSFMSGRFINQANLAGFLPYMVPNLLGKPCTGVEGACGTGGRSIAMAMRSVLSEMSDIVFVAAFEMQNKIKAIYNADVLAGASYYNKERKKGAAFFFPALFAERAGAYFKKYGESQTREAMARWYEQAIINARKNPKAQEYHNKANNLFELGMSKPNAEQFVPYLNAYDCSKVTDGASSVLILSEEGLKHSNIDKSMVVEIVGVGEAEGDITLSPNDQTVLDTTKRAVQSALDQAQITIHDIGVFEVHDCFSITGLLSLEAMGLAEQGKAPELVLSGALRPDGKYPTNVSGGLSGFGHPTGASGVRQMVDLWQQLTNQAPNQVNIQKPYGMMISMGGNDKTVTCIIVKA